MPASEPRRRLNTVSVPKEFAPIFEKAQDFVAEYFRNRVEDPEKSTISISGERYILVRAASMSVEFFDLVVSLYQDKGEAEARSVANNLLYDLAHAIGKADAKSFHKQMNVTDPIDRLSAGPVHFSFSGWAYVDILPESRPSPDENYYLIYNHPFSFESDAWIKRGRQVTYPVCIMNAGYSSGWCDESFGIPLVSSEVECRAKGDPECRFIMAPPSRIEEHLARYFEKTRNRYARSGVNNIGSHSFAVPEFFQRKRMEDALLQANRDLETRVQERTAELTRAYVQLKEQVREREISEARYRSLFERNVTGVFRSTTDGKFLDCNLAFAQLFGYSSREELLALPASVLYPGGEQDRKIKIEDLGKEKAITNLETSYRRKDGSLMWGLQNVSVTSDEFGNQVFEGTIIDITARRSLEAQLRQAQKMEAIGRLAGGVAHDFNNLLTVIRGYSELLLARVSTDPVLSPYATEIREASDRAAELTHQLLAFSRQQVMEPKVLVLNTVITKLDKMLPRLLGEDVELQLKLGLDIGRVKADPGQMEQVIINLAVNARDAMPDGGKLTIETANVLVDKEYFVEQTTLKPGPYVMLAVSDTGTGIDEQTRARLFEPFFTTKGPGKGTGLGLSTVYGIVTQSGGQVLVYSEIGIGTTFKLYLPRVDLPADELAITGSPQLPRGLETILVVEDETALRNLIKNLLETTGYKILLAGDAEQALELCRNHQGTIDLLFTDVVLTTMNGRELAQNVKQLRSSIKVLYMSGYTDDAILRHGILETGTAFLQKPFTTASLGQKVREVLDTPAATS